MAVPEDKVPKTSKVYSNTNELLPELELSIIPMKLSSRVRVDLYKLSDDFMEFLVTQGHLDDSVHNDIKFMTISKVAAFYTELIDAYKLYNKRKNANI